jgi:hypothetical protein
MRYAKFFGLLVVAAGMASAADWRDVRNDYGRNDYGRNERVRADYGRNDYGRNERMRADVARDRGRLNEDVFCGGHAVARDAAVVSRDPRYGAGRRDFRERDWR